MISGLITWGTGDSGAETLDAGSGDKTHMFRVIPWTWGSTAGGVVVESAGPVWAHPMMGRNLRVYPIRVRNDYWVESGHVETDDPATDTREV